MKGKTVYINYVDGIDTERVKNLMAIVTQIVAQEKPDNLYFLFSSNGGGVDAGIALYNFLKALPLKVYMHNIGTIDSIANVVFVAGKKRIAAPHATFLFHGVAWNIPGPTSLTLPGINEIRDRIHKNHDTIAGIICTETKMKEDEIKNLFAQGETKDINFALEKGIVHKVKLPQIPKDSLFVSVNFHNKVS